MGTSMQSQRTQRGSSLLEVLIAVLVMAIGMLGIAALQAVTLRNSNSSAGRSQAVIHIYSAFDTLRLNRDGALAGQFNVSDYTCAGVEAEEGDETDYSVFNGWLTDMQRDFPGSCGRIDCDSNTCTVGVQWNDSRATGGNATADDEPSEFQIASKL